MEKIQHPVTGQRIFASKQTAERLRAEFGEGEEKTLAEMTKKELVAYAEERDLDVDISLNKGDLLAAIEATEAENGDE